MTHYSYRAKDQQKKEQGIKFGALLPDLYLNKNAYHSYISVSTQFPVNTAELETQLNQEVRVQVHTFKRRGGNRTFIIEVNEKIKWRTLESIIRDVLMRV